MSNPACAFPTRKLVKSGQNRPTFKNSANCFLIMIYKDFSAHLDVMILAGGLGTRFPSVQKNKPKCLAMINGVPFIDLLINYYLNQGVNRFILSVGYLKEKIINHLYPYNYSSLNL